MNRHRNWTITLALAGLAGLASCAEPPGTRMATGIDPQVMADALHAVMESDRTVYTRNVVNRLQNEEGIIAASEHWLDDQALPLPAQMFRMGAEMVAEKTDVFSYSLLSLWPVNKQNAPRTAAETAGLEAVASSGEPYYTEEALAGTNYFTAVYPDVAVAQACISCHNEHVDSPRTDFELGDTMGGVVIRIPVGSDR